MTDVLDDLRTLAQVHGILTSYLDVEDREQHASDAALLGTLAALGTEIASPAAARGALDELQRVRALLAVEPVTATFASSADVAVRVPEGLDEVVLECALTFEDGDRREWSTRVKRAAPTVHVPTLPFGYHQLELTGEGIDTRTMLIVAPPRAYEPPGASDARAWGVFLPLYALRTQRSRGIADLDDLGRLAQ